MDNRTLLMWAVLLTLPACVTETTYTGQGNTRHDVVGPDLQAAAKTRLDLGIQYLRKGNTEQAKVNLDRALKYAPDSPEVHLGYAYFYQTVQDYAAAERSYQKVLTLSPQDADAMNNYGAFLCGRARYDEADAMFNRSVTQPGYAKIADTYENAAICATRSGKNDKASEYYRLALGYNPRKPSLLLDLAESAFMHGKLDEAQSYLNRYGEVAVENPDSLWLRLRLAQALDRPAQLHQYGSQLAEHFPDSQQAKRYLTNDY